MEYVILINKGVNLKPELYIINKIRHFFLILKNKNFNLKKHYKL